jgi:hypothetical protein
MATRSTSTGTTGTGTGNGVSLKTDRNRDTRLSTETKASTKTTEFIAYVAVLAGILIAGLIVDGDGGGADGGFSPSEVWQYATFLTIGYMISRGLAKSGSRDPYWAGGTNQKRDDDR